MKIKLSWPVYGHAVFLFINRPLLYFEFMQACNGFVAVQCFIISDYSSMAGVGNLGFVCLFVLIADAL